MKNHVGNLPISYHLCTLYISGLLQKRKDDTWRTAMRATGYLYIVVDVLFFRMPHATLNIKVSFW